MSTNTKNNPNDPTKNGVFIVIDGTDGSGKATQTQLLVDSLTRAGRAVQKIDFPQYRDNEFGRLIRECLDGKHGDFLGLDPKIASTLYAADRFESSPVIRGWLEDGYIVVSDRYVSANQIHQGGKISDPVERKRFLYWLDEIEYNVFGIPKPDVVVYLHVPLEISLDLIHKRAVESGVAADQAEQDAKHLLEAQQAAVQIVQNSNNWVQIDCAKDGTMRSREDIHAEICASIKGRL
jgi:dTMP kinase